MRIGTVIGNVTLSRVCPELIGARWLLVEPLSLEQLRAAAVPKEKRTTQPLESVVIYNDLGAALGCQVGFSEGREAAHPFHPERKPVDAYAACILDSIEIKNVSL